MNYKKIVLEKLCSMGFEPTLVGDIGYVFNYEEVNFLYMPDDDDDKFLRIAIPQMFEVTDENRIAVLEAMHETSLLLKYAKVNIMFESAVWALYEHRLVTSKGIEDLLEHVIQVLHATAMVFYKKINGDDFDIPGSDKSEECNDEDIEAKLEKLLESLEENGNE